MPGVRVGLHWSVLLIVALVTVTLAGGRFPTPVPGHAQLRRLLRQSVDHREEADPDPAVGGPGALAHRFEAEDSDLGGRTTPNTDY
ncbi:hypothetical protein [Streptomyces sp. NPDC001652]|uniref:hypothetical protein n=1 Tax=Streptomyces sp. NPDC001652 TaxID=3154393 RepID=UPI00331D7550